MSSVRTNNRRAISAVLTTIIILVASIVLGTAVVVYSTSLFQTGGQQQAIQVQGLKGWINATSTTATSGINAAWGGAAVRNVGDKILSVDNIQLRGTTIPFNNWFADVNPTDVNSGSNLQAQFNLTKTDINGYPRGSIGTGSGVTAGSVCINQMLRDVLPSSTNNAFQIDEDGPTGSSLALCFTQQAGPISLNPGQSAIIYFKVPNGVFTGLDSGGITTVSIFAGKVGAPQTIRMANP